MKLRFAAPFAAAALALGVLAPTASAQSSDLGTDSLDGDSLGNLAEMDTESLEGVLDADENEVCVLPNFGGSVEESATSIGAITQLPSGIIGSVGGSLGSADIPNPLALLGFDEILAETGSLEGPVCEILGGEMEDPNAPDPDPETGSLASLTAGSGEGSGSGS